MAALVLKETEATQELQVPLELQEVLEQREKPDLAVYQVVTVDLEPPELWELKVTLVHLE